MYVAQTFLGVCIIALSGVIISCSDTQLTLSEDNSVALAESFIEPPDSARPYVWWHWLNGNISREGIRKDLEWMRRIGIGGLQNFDVNFAVPSIVDDPVVYMSDEWQSVYRYSVEKADQLGLEFGIASSPGWSETGGPWVEPKDGMKKLAWSETTVTGGALFDGVLAPPPAVTGPFQDVAIAQGHTDSDQPVAQYYQDIAVLAYPVKPVTPLPVPVIQLGGGQALPAVPLIDGQFNHGVSIPNATATTPTVITITYPHPQTVHSAAVFIPGVADVYAGATVAAKLEFKPQAGDWQLLSDVRLSTVPTTVSFAATQAREFRLVLEDLPEKLSNSSGHAPGFDTGYIKAMAAIFGTKKTLSLNELRLSSETRLHQYEVKSGFFVAPDYYELADTTDAAPYSPIDEVQDITALMQSNGQLNWSVPVGTWRIVRLGYSLLGKTNHPATAEATGLEVDKLDAAAVRRYMESYLRNYRDAVGEDLIGKRGISAIVTDSTEVGAMNWTPDMLTQFQRLRGYNALPWLPVLTGAIIGSREQSDKFLYDFRRTIAELHASEHYGTVARVAHERGMKVYGESLEGWRPSLGDDLGMRRFADYPMAANWSYSRDEGPGNLYLADMRGAASTAHLYGQNIAAAESLTSKYHPWEHTPADLRRAIDLEFSHGINRIVIHSSVHQPSDDKVPGLSMRHIGQYFNRHTAWAEMAKPWIDYIARSSYLLQQGRFVADVAYFYGEEAPLGSQVWDGYFNDVPQRYGYDFINPHALLNLLSVQDGELVSDGGARYRVLYLGGTSERMTLPVLKHIAQLVESGATLVGNAPKGSPSLHDDPQVFSALVRQLWNGEVVNHVGKGRVIKGGDIEAALALIDIAPDVVVEAAAKDAALDIAFVHRQLKGGDIYFLSNRSNHSHQLQARFRVTGKAPQIWRADDGSRVPVSYSMQANETIVPLSFSPEESYFVVFVDDTEARSHTVPKTNAHVVSALSGSWTVTFQAGRGAPDTAIVLPQLISLSEHAEPAIKYFSGIATYSKNFSLPTTPEAGQLLWLELGKVGDIAEVLVNGRSVGSAWHPPYRVDISSAVHAGDNELVVRVANRWVNRLIGDAQPDVEKMTFTVTPNYQADAPLRPSGLMGPVLLVTDAEP